MTINPDDVVLTNLYTDATSNTKSTNVYANGEMQVMVFITVNYNGEGSIDDVTQYVSDNTLISYVDDQGDLHDVIWDKSSQSNGFHHDINNALSDLTYSVKESNIRVPVFFVVPIGSSGTYKWRATLNGMTTSTIEPVIVNVSNFEVSESDFDIIDVSNSQGSYTLRSIIYTKTLPNTHKLVKLTTYQGILFTGTGGNSWLSFMRSGSGHKYCAFPIYDEKSDNFKVAKNYMDYQDYAWQSSGLDPRFPLMCTSKWGWEPTTFSEEERANAWMLGITCIMTAEDGIYLDNRDDGTFSADRLNFAMQGFKCQDNYGNHILFDMDWDYRGEWYTYWKVINPRVIF